MRLPDEDDRLHPAMGNHDLDLPTKNDLQSTVWTVGCIHSRTAIAT
jgi:hypothetical protein